MRDSRKLLADHRTLLWGEFVTGGNPWRTSRLHPVASRYLRLLRSQGVAEVPGSLADSFVKRGLAHPLPGPTNAQSGDITVVIPVRDNLEGLLRALDSVRNFRTIVIDDASREPLAMETLAGSRKDESAIQLVRLESNAGAAFARNLGARLAETEFLLFLDSDCWIEPDWPEAFLGLFGDDEVVAIAPSITVANCSRNSMEWSVDTLNMGSSRDTVHPLGRLTFVPSACLLVRREYHLRNPFDNAMRLGEDVEWLWRAVAQGYTVRYEPTARVHHLPRPSTLRWLQRVFEYGTSAPDLAGRFDRYPAPSWPSVLNSAVILSVLVGMPAAGLVAAVAQFFAIHRRLPPSPDGPLLAGYITLAGAAAEARALGNHARREWWPLGVAATALSFHSPAARRFLGLMAAPILLDYLQDRRRPAIHRYVAGRLAADAAYGMGVWHASLRSRTWKPILRRRQAATDSARRQES